jgi:diguanylate cyclase (GGDEF)-like protein
VTGSVGDTVAGNDNRELSGATAIRRLLASVVVTTVAATLCLAAALASLASGAVAGGWSALLALAVGSVVAQVVRPGRRHSAADRTAIAFIAAGAVLLPLQLLVVLIVAHVVASWLGERRTWLERLINLAATVLAGLAASAGWQVLGESRPGAGALFAGVLAVVSLHVLRLPARRLLGRAQARPPAEVLVVDLVLVSLGATAAILWLVEPWLATLALGPLLLVQRSLAVPQLEAETRVDPKTGLYNARWFAQALEEELGRAARFERPLSLIMADLDLLRDINNAHGHLAGDAVLRGIAGIFRAQLRHYDVPARFGGEEFSILLPETSPEAAHEIAERIRTAVAARAFAVDTSPEPIRATISIGVAGFPQHAADANELVHRADVAVYEAKVAGRNRTVLASAGEPQPAAQVMRLPLAGEPVDSKPRSRPVGKPAVDRRRRSRPGPVRARLIDATYSPSSPLGVAAAGGALAGVAALIVGVVAASPALLVASALYAGAVFAGPLLLLRRLERRRYPAGGRPEEPTAVPVEDDGLEQVS